MTDGGATPVAAAAVLRPERSDEAGVVGQMVVDSFADDKLRELLADLRGSDAWIDGLSFVAELDGEVVGHVLFTRSWLDAPPRLVDVLVLSPLAVREDVRARGIGSALVRYGFDQVLHRPEPAGLPRRVPAVLPEVRVRPRRRTGLP